MKTVFLFIAFFLLNCSSFKNPFSHSNYSVHAILSCKGNNIPIKNTLFSFGSNFAATDANGYFSIQTPKNSKNINIFCFPFKIERIRSTKHLMNKNVEYIYLTLPDNLNTYLRLLEEAKLAGFDFHTVQYFWENKDHLSQIYFLIMRHDVDDDPYTAAALAKIEQLLDIEATYYFRWSTAEKNVISYIQSLNHEIGLHYETIAIYAKNKGIESKDQIDDSTIFRCRDILKKEISRFKNSFGPIYSVSSHGDDWNIRNGLSNSVLLKGQDFKEFGIKICATQLESNCPGIDLFLADSGGKWFPNSLHDILVSPPNHLYVLTHPIWWRDIEMWPNMVNSQYSIEQQNNYSSYFEDMLFQTNYIQENLNNKRRTKH